MDFSRAVGCSSVSGVPRGFPSEARVRGGSASHRGGARPSHAFPYGSCPAKKSLFLFPSAVSFGTFRFQHGGAGWGRSGEQERQLPRLSRSPTGRGALLRAQHRAALEGNPEQKAERNSRKEQRVVQIERLTLYLGFYLYSQNLNEWKNKTR